MKRNQLRNEIIAIIVITTVVFALMFIFTNLAERHEKKPNIETIK